MTIGVFDSGVGGLSVVRQLKAHRILYFADTAHFPYGPRNDAEIIALASSAISFLIEKGATNIILACNTVASVAARLLREKHSIPIYDLIRPAVLAATSVSSGRIGLIGTEKTIQKKIFETETFSISPNTKLFSVACPLLAPIVEYGSPSDQATRLIVHAYLETLLQEHIDTLLLGCTHYPFLRPHFALEHVHLIDPAEYLKAPTSTSPSLTCFVSGNSVSFQKRAEQLLQKSILVHQVLR